MPIALLRPRSRPPGTLSSPRHAGRARSFAVGVVGAAILVSGFVAPASAARPPTAHPSVSATTRAGAAVRTTAARVDARAAAQLARTEHRNGRTAPRLTADVGAPRGTTKSRQTTESTQLAVTGSTQVLASSTSQLVPGTTLHQVTTSFPGIEQADTCDCEPPDPWIAVSPSHVVPVVATRSTLALHSYSALSTPSSKFESVMR